MCGVAGIIGPTVGEAALLSVDAMLARLAHRGPDGVGSCRVPGAAIGFRRLQIVGGPSGAQPLVNCHGDVVAVCNGEIYNHAELRRSLERRGHTIMSKSDCAVVPHLYEEYGSDFVHHLRGQFAIAVWDSKQRRAILARDRFGICPLFWTIQDHELTFASEVKAIFARPHIPRAVDVEGLAQVAALYSSVAPRTSFRGIFQVPPGGIVVHDLNTESTTVEQWWQADAAVPLVGRRDATPESLRSLLDQAVARRMQGDGQGGLYLSGGVDSSLVAALAAKHGATEAYAIRFADNSYDESKYQRQVAECLGLVLHQVDIDDESLSSGLSRAVWHAEVPLFRTAPIPMMLLAEEVHADGLKFVLGGEGADEIFLGYPYYLRLLARLAAAEDGRSEVDRARSLAAALQAKLPTNVAAVLTELGIAGPTDRALPVLTDRFTRTRKLFDLFHPALELDFTDVTSPARRGAGRGGGSSSDPMTSARALDAATKLSGYLLATQGDRMSMSSAVEQRFPFLDEDVVDFALGTPGRSHLRGHQSKVLIRDAARGLLPEQFAQREKQGYLAPNNSALLDDGGSLKPFVRDLLDPELTRKVGCFDPSAVEARATGDASAQIDSSLVFVVTTHLLHLQFVEGGGASADV